MFIDLFQEIEVENLFKALDLCMEYVRLDLHVSFGNFFLKSGIRFHSRFFIY